MITWLIDAVGMVIAILILAGILMLAGIGALAVYAACVVSGRAAQWEEDNLGIRRS